MTTNPNKDTLAIQLKKGDTTVSEDCSFIKMDVEGHENNVIVGMTELLKKNKPVICFELIPKNIEDKTLIETLKELGYKNFYTVYRKSVFPVTWKKSFYTAFLDGLLFKPTHQLKSIKDFDQPFYNLIFCEHMDSEFRIKESSIVN